MIRFLYSAIYWRASLFCLLNCTVFPPGNSFCDAYWTEDYSGFLRSWFAKTCKTVIFRRHFPTYGGLTHLVVSFLKQCCFLFRLPMLWFCQTCLSDHHSFCTTPAQLMPGTVLLHPRKSRLLEIALCFALPRYATISVAKLSFCYSHENNSSLTPMASDFIHCRQSKQSIPRIIHCRNADKNLLSGEVWLFWIAF